MGSGQLFCSLGKGRRASEAGASYQVQSGSRDLEASASNDGGLIRYLAMTSGPGIIMIMSTAILRRAERRVMWPTKLGTFAVGAEEQGRTVDGCAYEPPVQNLSPM